MEMQTDTLQSKAIELCSDLSKRLIGVTGQAGTGKTTIIKQAVEHFSNNGVSFAVAAPTGKAARRIREATGIPAVTVHKLLEYPKPGEYDQKTGKPLDSGSPKRNRGNPLTQKVIFVDEYAMVNVELHNNLLAALPPGGCLRAFGDLNQLPPIEEFASKIDPRTPFARILGDHPSVTLENVFRQAEGSEVLEAATMIRNGRVPAKKKDFNYTVVTRPIHALQELVLESLEGGIDYGSITNQIITPSKKTWTGTVALNGMLRSLLNPNPSNELPMPREKWMAKFPVTVGVGDKVVCTENTYDLRNYDERYAEWDDEHRPILHSFIDTPATKQMLNGEIGKVLEIHPDETMEIDFGDRVVELPPRYYEYWSQKDTIIEVDPKKKIDLAYALTTHKCQGSEFENVIYMLNKSMSFGQNRQNFYTAVTRAKKSVRVISDAPSLAVTVRNLAR